MTDVHQSALNFSPAQAPDGNGGVTPPAGTRPLSRGAEQLLQVLGWYFKKFPRVCPPQSKLAELLKRTIRQVQRYVRELREAGIITVQKYGRLAAEYFIQAEGLEKQNVGSESGLSRVCVALKSRLSRVLPYSLNLESVSASSDPATKNQPQRMPPRKALTPMEQILQKYGAL